MPQMRKSTALQGSKAGIGSCAAGDEGCVVAQGSTGPEFWFCPVPCPHGGLFHDAESADHFHTAKIFPVLFKLIRMSKCPQSILLSEQ